MRISTEYAKTRRLPTHTWKHAAFGSRLVPDCDLGAATYKPQSGKSNLRCGRHRNVFSPRGGVRNRSGGSGSWKQSPTLMRKHLSLTRLCMTNRTTVGQQSEPMTLGVMTVHACCGSARVALQLTKSGVYLDVHTGFAALDGAQPRIVVQALRSMCRQQGGRHPLVGLNLRNYPHAQPPHLPHLIGAEQQRS